MITIPHADQDLHLDQFLLGMIKVISIGKGPTGVQDPSPALFLHMMRKISGLIASPLVLEKMGRLNMLQAGPRVLEKTPGVLQDPHSRS